MTKFYVSDLDQDDLEVFKEKYNDYLDYLEWLAYVVTKYDLNTDEHFEINDITGEIYYVV